MKKYSKGVQKLLKEQGHKVPVSELEEEYYARLKQLKIPMPERQYRFYDDRKWPFDFAWPDKKVAVEIDGGIWSGGRHTRGRGFIGDCDKINRAQILGWVVLRFTREHMDSGDAYALLLEALGWEIGEDNE